jgi:uncharacterized protein YndB with AHSA1/START domain
MSTEEQAMSEHGVFEKADLRGGIERAEQAMSEFGVVTRARTVRFNRVLPGPIERVWAYLTESDKRATWLAAGPMELRVGGPVELTFRNADLTPHAETPPDKYKARGGVLRGRITRCEPPRLLSYTWGEASGGKSEVTFELSPQGEDVLLALTHRRLPDRTTMVNVGSGWHTHLGILVDHLSGREPQPFWSTYTRLEAEYEQRLPAE